MNRAIATLVLLGLATGGAVACDTDDTSDAKPTKTATAEKQPSKESKDVAEPKQYPSPNAAQTRDLISALRAIDPGLVVKESRAVDRSRNTCMNIKDGEDPAKVQSMAEMRFEGGNVPDLSSAQTAQIIKAVKTTFCE